MNGWVYKIGFYLLSMFFFLVIVMILGTKIPVYFGKDWEFIGWEEFCRQGVIIPVICTLLIIGSMLFCLWLFQWNKGSRMGPVTDVTYTNVSGDVMSFVASYFFPLVSFNLGATWQHAVVLGILFVLIGAIYVKADIYYCNPTLLLLGFRIYKAKGTIGKNGDFDQTVITWGKLESSKDNIKYIPIDEKTCFAFKIKNDKRRNKR